MISRRPEQVFDSEPRAGSARQSTESHGAYSKKANHILEAATRTIARLGYQGASMRELAKEAQVSLAGIYHYFDSKERLLFVIQFRTFNSLLGNLREKLHGVDDPVEQLRVMVRAHVGHFATDMAALKVCSHELDSLSGPAYEETRRIRLEYYNVTRAIVDRIADEHACNAGLDRRVATMSLFGTLNWLYRWYDPARGPSPNVVANQISAQFLTGLIGASGTDGEA